MNTKEQLSKTMLHHDGKTPFFIDEEHVAFLCDKILTKVVGENIPPANKSLTIRVIGKFFDWSSIGNDASKTFSKFLHTKKLSLSFEMCTFVGGLNFIDGCQFETVSFTDCQFPDPSWNKKPRPYQSLNISHCNFEKLVLRRCMFANDVVIHNTYFRIIEMVNTFASWVHLAGIGYPDTCELKIHKFSGGEITFPSEKNFNTIISDKESLLHFEKGAGKVIVYV